MFILPKEEDVVADIYVVVGFKVKEAKSVAYYKSHDIDDCLEDIKRAFDRAEADFVSVRHIVRD